MSSPAGSEDEQERLTGQRDNEELANATNETSSIIVELSLEEPIHVRWVSPSWKDIVGTEPSTLMGSPIEKCLADDDKTCFAKATRQLLLDDSQSVRCRFWLVLPPNAPIGPMDDSPCADPSTGPLGEALEVDANGILIHDRMVGTPTHTMWVFSIVQDYKSWEGDLEAELAEALLGGAEFLSTFLKQLSLNPELPTPNGLTCNICDRQIQPWFFEKHTALCIVSHKAESEVQDCHDHLQDHRQVITEILRNLETGPGSASFNGLHICNPPLSPISKLAGIVQSPKIKAEKNRKLQIRVAELIVDYCDLALDISTPAIPEEDTCDVFGRIQSPDSTGRIIQLQAWNAPSIDDPALKALYEETHELVTAKLSAVTRLHNTIHYSEKIRQEIDLRVQELIDMTAENGRIYRLDEDAIGSENQIPFIDLNAPYIAPTRPMVSRSSSTASDRSREFRFRDTFERPESRLAQVATSNSIASSPTKMLAVLDPTVDQEPRAASPLSQFPPLQGAQVARSSLSWDMDSDQPKKIPLLTTTDPGEPLVSSSPNSRSDSPHDLDQQIREARSRGLYDSPRRPSGSPRPPKGFSPSRRASRAVSRSRAVSLARDRALSPGRKSLGPRLSLIERERLSPAASPTLSASDSISTDASTRERRISVGPPLSPRLPSIAPAARPAPPSIKDFDIIKPISKGAFGSVYLSKKRTNGDYYAIKVLKKADMIAKNQVTNIKAERAIMMAQTESPFIAKLYYTFQSKEYLYLVMEYLNGGDCAALIKQMGGLPEDWTKRYMSEVVLGLEYLHSRGIIHRDLKPDNLLISHNGHLKLTDFGLSRVGLVGRQNRARTSSHPETPDLLSSTSQSNNRTSPASSRSASFDFAQSGLSTPAMAPMVPSDARSGYFHLRDRKASYGELSETSKSESDTFTSAMSKLVLDDSKYESDDAASTASGQSSSGQTYNRPGDEYRYRSSSVLSSAAQMPPPAMKLFDPKVGPKRFVGTPDYLAPETINGSGQDDMVDWWSLGVILFEFLYGYPPFHAQSPDAVFSNILNRRIDWPSVAEEMELEVSDAAKDLINKLMTMKPSERLGSQEGATDIKTHPFFDGVVWEKISEEEALFVPTPDHPEDTDYFDSRGATNHVFEEDSDTQNSADASPSSSDREVRATVTKEPSLSSKIAAHSRQLIKRTMIPLSIPPHVRDRRHRDRRLSESGKDEFGSFTFKNLSVLEKQNLEAIRKLRTEQSLASPANSSREAQSAAVHIRSASSSGSSRARRTASSASSISSSTPISPTNHSNTLRVSIPSSPLISSGSPKIPDRRRSKGSIPSSFVPSVSDPTSLALSSGTNNESPTKAKPHANSLPSPHIPSPNQRNRSFTVGAQPRPEVPFAWSSTKRISRVLEPEATSSSSDNEASSSTALQRVQHRRQRSQRLSSISISLAAEPSRVHRPLDVLICEDNPVSRRVLEAMLGKLKCLVVSVVDGAQAVAAATGDVVFDIIFTDIKVPRLSGVEVARLIRSTSGSNTDTPIVAMSSYSTADFQDIAQFFEKRLEKPLTIAAISETLQEMIIDWAPPKLASRH